MNKKEFEQFVEESGKDILRYCRMIAYSNEAGNELYQDTMLKLLEKQESLDCEQNIKSYAISISILLLKNKKRKYAVRNKKAGYQVARSYMKAICTDTEVSKAVREHTMNGLTLAETLFVFFMKKKLYLLAYVSVNLYFS